MPHHLIPPLLRFDRWYPGIGAERFDASRFVLQSVPSIAGGVDDGIVIRMQPMREEALLEVKPHALDRVELGRIGWQRHWGDGVRHAQTTCAVPTGLIENHDDMLVLPDRGSEAVEELLHCLGVGVRHNEGEAVVSAGFDRREDVGERKALVAQPWRALTAPPPDVARPSLLADARLVLEKEADTLVFMRMLNFSEKCRGSF